MKIVYENDDYFLLIPLWNDRVLYRFKGVSTTITRHKQKTLNEINIWLLNLLTTGLKL